MPKVVDFVFNNLSRLGQDEYNFTQDNLVNNNHSNYMLTNLFNDNEKQPFGILTSHPTMNLKGSMNVGPRGYNIEESSELLHSDLTNLNKKVNLQERSYKTVPYLGKGNVDVVLESNLKAGDTLKDKKSATQLGESCFMEINKYPLDEELKSSYTDDKKMVEESAAKGWIRGGILSRDLYKDKETKCN